MLNNFDKFPYERADGEFYFFQIIKRKKDNPDISGLHWNNHARCIKEYSVYSLWELEKRKQEMIDIATTTNSRIYMHPSRRHKDNVQKLMCLLMAENIYCNKHSLSWLYRHACGISKGTNKLYVVDVDGDKKDLDKCLDIVKQCRPFREPFTIIKTKNGYHIIAYPFDVIEFKKHFPHIDIHKNNPTLIYVP